MIEAGFAGLAQVFWISWNNLRNAVKD